jgi:hypothetical protein
MLQLTVRCQRAAGCSHEPSCIAGEQCAYWACVAVEDIRRIEACDQNETL